MVDYDGETFADWLRKTRTRKHVNASDLARKAGVSRQYISALENSHVQLLTGRPAQPSLKVVEKLAAALDADLTEARRVAGHGVAPGEGLFDASTGMFKGLDKLSPEKQRLAKRQIEAIINSLAEEDHDTDYIDDDEESDV